MPEEDVPAAPDDSLAQEPRPVDLGLSEGKSIGFAPTSAVPPDGPPIGGLAPASAAADGEPAAPAEAPPAQATTDTPLQAEAPEPGAPAPSAPADTGDGSGPAD